MDLVKFLESVDVDHPDWSSMPDDFPDCDLGGLTSDQVGRFLSIKTMWELGRPVKTEARSRVGQSAKGFRFLVQWSNLVLLRILVRKFTETLPKGEYRTKTQLDDAARSCVSNVEEGYRRATTSEYLEFLGFSEGSLAEVHGDINKCYQDGFIRSVKGSNLADLGIDLGEWGEWVKVPENQVRILEFKLQGNRGGYRSLKEVNGRSLTYEMMVELCNKSDWLLRKLVVALEKKLGEERKGYQIEKARISRKAGWGNY